MTLRTVIGWIRMYNDEQGFGYAETSDLVTGKSISVRFRGTGARNVITTATGYRVGSERLEVPSLYVNRRDPQRIVMLVRESNGRWSADKWSFRPGPNWAHSSILLKNYDQFPGGAYRQTDDDNIEVATGVITTVTLTPEQIDIQLEDGRRLTFNLDDSREGNYKDGIFIRLPRVGKLYFAFPAR